MPGAGSLRRRQNLNHPGARYTAAQKLDLLDFLEVIAFWELPLRERKREREREGGRVQQLAVGEIHDEAIFEDWIFRIIFTQKEVFFLATKAKQDYTWISY